MSGKLSFVVLLWALAFIPYCVAQSRQKLNRCPRRCRCFSAIDSSSANARPGVEVDCGNKKFTDLPSIPRNTITLAVQDNNLLQILPRSFNRTRRLQQLFLYRNKIRRIHWEAFQGLGNLQTLSLFDNELTKINNGTFRYLSTLKKLYLYQNRIKYLNKNSFLGLSSLKLLSLRDNRLSSIERGTFSPLARLDSLFLFRNGLTTLTNGMFEGLRSLKILIIGFNRISRIENGAFRGLSRLTELFIDNNKLDRISSRMFADLISLKRLHIYNNAIKHIDPGSFFRLRELTFISCHHNNISHISQGMFAGLESLRILYLQANRIDNIDSGSFVDLKTLRSLYLYQNKIEKIGKDTLVGLQSLRVLHLGFNMISEIDDGAFIELKQVTTLYLDSNRLSRIVKGTFAGLISLLDLYIYFNQITLVEYNAFEDNKQLRYISWDVPRVLKSRAKYRNIPGNHLFCDCHVKYLKRWLSKHPVLHISCFEPRKVRDISLQKITKSDLEKCHEPRIDTKPQSATVTTGGSVLFYCTGAPVVEYMWYKNGSRILSKGDSTVSSFGTLSLTNVKKADEGLYVCVGKSKDSFSMATVSLTVGYKPYFTNLPVSTDVYAGSKIKLYCEIESNPPSKMTWRKNREEILSDDERVFQTFQGTLVILNAKKSDEGTYSCEAWNTIGMISKDADVTVKKGKEVDQSLKLSNCASFTTVAPSIQATDIDLSGSGSGGKDDEDDDDDDDDNNGDSSSTNDDKRIKNPAVTSVSPPETPVTSSNSRVFTSKKPVFSSQTPTSSSRKSVPPSVAPETPDSPPITPASSSSVATVTPTNQ